MVDQPLLSPSAGPRRMSPEAVPSQTFSSDAMLGGFRRLEAGTWKAEPEKRSHFHKANEPVWTRIVPGMVHRKRGEFSNRKKGN